MGKPSKESKVLELFFNEPSKYWHFREIVKTAGISENRANFWLKSLLKEKIILYHQPKGKMPYYTANFDHSNYKTKKKLSALEKFYRVGFLNHLTSLKAEAVVIFGSFSRADWHTRSDIDLFILGNDRELEKGRFERLLQREIQLFAFRNRKEIKRANPYLFDNILNGYFVKGNVQNLIRGNNA